MKEITLKSLKLTQVISERTGSCVRVISIDRGSYGPGLKQNKTKKQQKKKGALKGRERMIKPPISNNVSSEVCVQWSLLKLFKSHMMFSS